MEGVLNSLLFDDDPIVGKRQILHVDEVDDKVVFEEKHDVTDILETNKALQNMVDEKANWKGEMHRVASIPMGIFMELQRKGITKDKKAFLRWLDDPEQKVFRTRPGKLSK